MKHPPERRPRQPLSEPGAEMVTHTLTGQQLWRQYGWIDHLGRMYDLGESPADYRVASFSVLWVLVDDELPVLTEEELSEATFP